MTSEKADCEYLPPCAHSVAHIKDCSCSTGMVYRSLQRISGPLLDRIGIHLDVPRFVADVRPNRTVNADMGCADVQPPGRGVATPAQGGGGIVVCMTTFA